MTKSSLTQNDERVINLSPFLFIYGNTLSGSGEPRCQIVIIRLLENVEEKTLYPVYDLKSVIISICNNEILMKYFRQLMLCPCINI